MTSVPSLQRPSDIPLYEMVCDLCLTPNSVRWTYLTDNNVDEATYVAHRDDPQYRAPDGRPMFYMRDLRWAVCQTCHELVQANNYKVLFGRMLAGHRDRKRKRLAEATHLAHNVADRDEAAKRLASYDAMIEAEKSAPALAVMRDMGLQQDLALLVDQFMHYRHPEVYAEQFTVLDRVLATRWEPYTAAGAWPLMPVPKGSVADGAEPGSPAEVVIERSDGPVMVLSDGTHESMDGWR